MREPVFAAARLCKSFGPVHALRDVSLTLEGASIIGLLGRNAAGKTTLLRHVVGLQLPTSGDARTFGSPTASLSTDQLARIGVVTQEPVFVRWMTVGQQLRYLSGFYPRWDAAREAHLLAILELDTSTRIADLSTGSLQKLAIVAACCHRPSLLLLDEPVSNLDPIVRERFLAHLLEVVQQDEATIVISSHVLHDIESIVDRVICLESGRLTADAALDDLKARHSLWHVAARSRDLPARFDEHFVAHVAAHAPRRARLVVAGASDADRAAFALRHDVEIDVAAANLQAIFPALVSDGVRA